ncbi:MAG: ABC transporter permease [Dehalococcoidia bacterium]|nr:ABC transporter permease [Dehalococcoidia bacterium]
MNIRRTVSITRKIFRSIIHDWRALAMMFITPIVGIVVFGVAFSGDVSHVRVVVVNQDEGYQIPPATVPVSLADAIIANCDPDVMRIDEAATEEEGLRRVREGKAYGLIVFSSTFTGDVYAKALDPTLPMNPRIRVELDYSNVTVANAITKAVSDAMLKASQSLGIESPLNMDVSQAVYAADANFRDFFVPGIMGFIMFMLTFILTLLTFVGERTSGSLQRLQVTPLTDAELVMGYALAFSIIAIIQTAIVLVTIVAVFDAMMVGNVLLAFVVVAVLAIMSLSLGILCSSLAKAEAQAIQFLPMVAMPCFLLSGIFWPIEAIPVWLRPLSYAVPPTYAVNATRSVMLRGWGLEHIWVELVAMVAFTVAFLALSVWSLHRSRG